MLSPLLANIALHGMEAALGIEYHPDGTRKRSRGKLVTDAAVVVRYADDFVIACYTRKGAEWAIDQLTPWLAQRGLRFSPTKTRIVNIHDGFDFLGFNVRRYKTTRRRSGHVLLIKPSRDAVAKHRQQLRKEWLAHRGRRVGAVVTDLNPIIRGWSNYFRHSVASRSFRALDKWMYRRERRYVKHQHPTKPAYWTTRRYWGKLRWDRDDNWVFGDIHSGAFLWKHSWHNIVRHVQVKGTASPDNPAQRLYWDDRKKQATALLSKQQQRLARRQHYVCDMCGEGLANDEALETHHLRLRSQGGSNRDANLVLRHLYCHQQAHAQVRRHEQGGA